MKIKCDNILIKQKWSPVNLIYYNEIPSEMLASFQLHNSYLLTLNIISLFLTLLEKHIQDTRDDNISNLLA